MSNVTCGTDWRTIDWKKVNQEVRNLRLRIYRAAKQNDLKKVRSLQRLMLRSYANRLLSVRRVTQLNAGKDTPGVDKLTIKTPEARGKFADMLKVYEIWKAKPVRRVYIPKTNGKKRPLGIPVMLDRAVQAMVKNALEPYWESKFECGSYGFRPGRGCHDAIEAIYNNAKGDSRNKKKFVLDADIKGAFDNINHKYLLEAIGNFPSRELIKQWLKAGYVEMGKFHTVESGTPQGGVISPLLANVALHGMEEALGIKFRYIKSKGVFESKSKRALVRYADDFVVLTETLKEAEECKRILEVWLIERGLEFSKEKTRIVSLTEGFNFLGFNVRRYEVEDRRSKLKLLIKPSKESVQKFRDNLKESWMKLVGFDADLVVKSLNPKIKGWGNYFRVGVSAETFYELDAWIYGRVLRWAKRTHPKKNLGWIRKRYFTNNKPGTSWGKFGDKASGVYLALLGEIKIKRHIKVVGNYSPDDPELKDYWETRMSKDVKSLAKSRQILAKRQRGKCTVCGDSLLNGEELHAHHIVPRSEGGKDKYDNLNLVHLYCHQQIHSKKSLVSS
ncbi:MAG TPA: group II intron reverse transcriptase/maturase [Oculatellaceae cyanobacterium]|jgi:RNA-directed DNA polymerase